jgi:hypothetical protein
MGPGYAESADALWDDEHMVKRTVNEDVSFAYHGESVDDGTMDLADYGKALVGYADMVRTAIRVADPNARIPDVRIVRTEKGSFVTHLAITVDISLVQALMDWLNGSGGQALSTGLGMAADGIAVVGGLVGGALALGKLMRGRAVKNVKENGDGTSTITLQDDETHTAPTTIVNITTNNFFRDGVRQFVDPTTRPGVDSVTLGDESDPVETLTASDRYFFDPVENEVGQVIDEPDVRLNVERVSFDDGSWRFSRPETPDGRLASAFNADVRDDRFLDEVASSSESFRRGDQLRVSLRTEVPAPTVGGRPHRRYTVLEVLDVIHHEPPPPLFGDDFGDDGEG